MVYTDNFSLSLPEFLIRPRFTNEASEFVPVQVLGPLFQRVYRKVSIRFQIDHTYQQLTAHRVLTGDSWLLLIAHMY